MSDLVITINNMELWDRVCKTNPKHTKKVDQRGGFTAIDAMYQIQTATEVFGAVGKGWGWSFSEPIFPPNDTVVIKCTLWHGNSSYTIEHFGQKKLNSSKGADEDAFKKAATDGLTKCLSYLGFNADVFLGKFDDNKYVENLLKEEAKRKAANEWVDNYIKGLLVATSISEYEEKNSAELKRLKTGYPDLIKKIDDAIKDKLVQA